MLRPGPHPVVLVPDRRYARAYLLRVGDTDQSYVDLNDPLHLEFDYVQRLADVLDSVAPSGERVRVVHVGGAGLTFPRYVAATRPRSAQLVFEPDVELTALVRAHLPLPPRSGIRVRGVAGRPGITELRVGYADLLVVDAFAGSQVPAELVTLEFWAEVRRVLTAEGAMAINVTDQGPFGYVRRVVAGLAATFPHVVCCAEPATIKGRRFGNVVLVASGRPLPVAELAERCGRGPYPYRVLHGARLTQLIGGAPPFADADGDPSPLPPYGLTHFG